MDERLEAVRQRMEPAIDSGECEESDVTAEQVAEMLHALLEENRVRPQEWEKQCEARRWRGDGPRDYARGSSPLRRRPDL